MNKRTLYYLLSPKLRRYLRMLYYLPLDIYEKITGKRGPLTPPRGKIFIGSGDFIRQGKKLSEHLIKYGRLNPENRVLDVGCGIGRTAIPLTQILNEKGSYEGFDVVRSGIKWCRKKISTHYPNFNFKHINLKNDLYNLSTCEEAKNFVFPYNDDEFDLVFLFSVFTHMLPGDVDNYIKQISRVLKNGGVCIATFFIYNNDAKKFMVNNQGLKFNYDKGYYLLHNANVKEANVAFYEDYLKDMIALSGLKINHFYYGHWSGRDKSECIDFQDMVVLQKE